MENITATYTKLPDGKWGVRARCWVGVGTSLLVKTRGGGSRRVVVAEEVFDEHYQPGMHLYAVKDEPRGAKREVKCRYAGTAECGGCPHCSLRAKSNPQMSQRSADEDGGRSQLGSRLRGNDDGMGREITKEEAAREMERAETPKELFEWLKRNQGRFGAEKKEILGYFNMRMRKIKVIATDRFQNRQRKTFTAEPQRTQRNAEGNAQG
jgi:hypothetical protein